MAATLIVAGVLFLFGGMLLILMCGYFTIEQDRARNKINQFETWENSLFFTRPVSDIPQQRNEPVEDSIVAEVERYLKDELDLVDKFVFEPSVENLYQHVHKKVSRN